MADTDGYFYANKEREYTLFLIWRYMPHDIPKDVAEKMFATDDVVLALSQIHTQKELAKYLHVRPNTITKWKEEPVPEQFKEYDWRYWARKATPRLVSAILREALKTGDPKRADWWMTHVEGYEPKLTHRLTDADGGNIGGVAGMILRAEKRLKERGESD